MFAYENLANHPAFKPEDKGKSIKSLFTVPPTKALKTIQKKILALIAATSDTQPRDPYKNQIPDRINPTPAGTKIRISAPLAAALKEIEEAAAAGDLAQISHLVELERFLCLREVEGEPFWEEGQNFRGPEITPVYQHLKTIGFDAYRALSAQKLWDRKENRPTAKAKSSPTIRLIAKKRKSLP